MSDPAATFWRPATPATPRPCQPCLCRLRWRRFRARLRGRCVRVRVFVLFVHARTSGADGPDDIARAADPCDGSPGPGGPGTEESGEGHGPAAYMSLARLPVLAPAAQMPAFLVYVPRARC
jgi:hypothetical protein